MTTDTKRTAGPGTVGLLVFLAAAALALLATGLAGDEEIAHYLIARRAPLDPSLFLSLVGRPLVTLALAVPAQLGLVAARLASAVAAGATAYCVVRTARSAHLPMPWLGGVFLLLQPFWLAHAGTAMTEPWSALLVALLLLAFVEERPGLAITAAALLPAARMELVALWPLAIVCAWQGRRSWMIGLLVAPLLLWAALGALHSGDPLWLVHQAEWRAYPEREPWHYLRSFVWVIGAGLFVPVMAGLVSLVRPVPETPRRVVIGAGFVFLAGVVVYTFFAWWRPITFGNLRYLAALAPAAALLAHAGLRAIRSGSLAIWIACSFSLVGACFAWSHPWFHDHTMLERFDVLPLAAALVWIATIALAARRPEIPVLVAVALGIVSVVRDHLATLHLRPDAEEIAVTRLARTLSGDLAAGRRLYMGHPGLYHALGVNPYDRARFPGVDDATAAAAEPGAVFVWDSHYARSERPDSLLADSSWVFRGGAVSADSVWVGGVFERPGSGGSVSRSPDASAWLAAARSALIGFPGVKEMAEADPASVASQRALAGHLLLLGRTGEGMAVFRAVERMDPGNPETGAFRAELLLRSGDVTAARTAVRKALDGRPGDGKILALASRIEAAAGRARAARDYLIRAADALPNEAEIQFAAGAALRDAGDLDAAEKRFVRVAKLDPRDTRAGIALADLAWRRHRPGEALEHLRTLIRRRPDCVQAHLSLGEILLQQGHRREAVAVWRAGLEATHGNAVLARRVREVERVETRTP